MKTSITTMTSLAVLAIALCGTAHAYDNAPRDRQYMGNDQSNNDMATINGRPNPHYNSVSYYNHDAEARNRGENNTGANMGPGGRNSGFDDNEALHGSSSRHINDTNIDVSDNYNRSW